MSIPVYVAHVEPLCERISRKMFPQSHPALPVSKQDGHNIKSGAIDCQIHFAVLVEIAGHDQLGRNYAAGSMVSQRRWQKCGGKDYASQRCELYFFHIFLSP